VNKKIDIIIPTLRIARIRRKFLELLANIHIEDVHAMDSELLQNHHSFRDIPLPELWELEAVVERTRGNRRFLELYSMVEFAIYESAFLKKLILLSTKKTEVNQLTKENLSKPIYIERTRDSVIKNGDSEYKKLFITVKNSVGNLSDREGWIEFLEKNELQVYRFFENEKVDLVDSFSLRDFRFLYSNNEITVNDSTGFHFKELTNYIDAMQEYGNDDKNFNYKQLNSILFNGKALKVTDALNHLEPLRRIRNCLTHDFGWPEKKLAFF
jgi:hypothetical protein